MLKWGSHATEELIWVPQTLESTVLRKNHFSWCEKHIPFVQLKESMYVKGAYGTIDASK